MTVEPRFTITRAFTSGRCSRPPYRHRQYPRPRSISPQSRFPVPGTAGREVPLRRCPSGQCSPPPCRRRLRKAYFLLAFAALVILLLDSGHHILGAVLTVLHIHVRHRTHHCIKHRSGCRGVLVSPLTSSWVGYGLTALSSGTLLHRPRHRHDRCRPAVSGSMVFQDSSDVQSH